MVYMLLVDGFEEIEALEPLDILRRAGVEVQTVGVCGKRVTGAHQITVEADIAMDAVQPDAMELLILPGGPGHQALGEDQAVQALIDTAYQKGCYIAAICAAPSILGRKGLLRGKAATCFPGYEEFLDGADVRPDAVVFDAPFITGKGAGAAAAFGFQLVELLKGRKTAETLRGAMQYCE